MILEGFAAGVPVVASRVDGISEVIGEDGAAILVAPDDETALADALRRALSEEDLRAQMVAGGRERARHYSRQRTADLYLEQYRRVAT